MWGAEMWLIGGLLVTPGLAVTPPEAPLSGPGGLDYPYADVAVSEHGTGAQHYWLYEPEGAVDAPVVLYLHGYGNDGPASYEALLMHLARRGNTVVYPRMGNLIAVWDYVDNAGDALLDALDVLASPGHVAPQPDRLAFVGHSLGGVVALHLANRTDLPDPASVVLHDGAGAQTPAYVWLSLDTLDDVSPQTLLVALVAETSFRDRNATDVVRAAVTKTPQITRDQKNVIVVRSDDYGSPPLVSDHLGVHGGPTDLVDAIDWYGYWMPTDAALSEGWYGLDGAWALGDGDEVRDMGSWSDGTPVVQKVPAADFGL